MTAHTKIIYSLHQYHCKNIDFHFF
jgi:hypothetical protein